MVPKKLSLPLPGAGGENFSGTKIEGLQSRAKRNTPNVVRIYYLPRSKVAAP